MKSSYTAYTGHERYRHFHKSTGPRAERRRKTALQRISEQIADSIPTKPGKLPDETQVLLNDSDIARIHKEIDILASRITNL